MRRENIIIILSRLTVALVEVGPIRCRLYENRNSLAVLHHAVCTRRSCAMSSDWRAVWHQLATLEVERIEPCKLRRALDMLDLLLPGMSSEERMQPLAPRSLDMQEFCRFVSEAKRQRAAYVAWEEQHRLQYGTTLASLMSDERCVKVQQLERGFLDAHNPMEMRPLTFDPPPQEVVAAVATYQKQQLDELQLHEEALQMDLQQYRKDQDDRRNRHSLAAQALSQHMDNHSSFGIKGKLNLDNLKAEIISQKAKLTAGHLKGQLMLLKASVNVETIKARWSKLKIRQGTLYERWRGRARATATTPSTLGASAAAARAPGLRGNRQVAVAPAPAAGALEVRLDRYESRRTPPRMRMSRHGAAKDDSHSLDAAIRRDIERRRAAQTPYLLRALRALETSEAHNHNSGLE